MKKLAVQGGENEKYPKEVDIWTLQDPVPEWLSDAAKVKFVDGDGNLTLDFVETSNGGIDIIDSSGNERLVNLVSKKSIVCHSTSSGSIFSLTPIQFNLLYKIIEK